MKSVMVFNNIQNIKESTVHKNVKYLWSLSDISSFLYNKCYGIVYIHCNSWHGPHKTFYQISFKQRQWDVHEKDMFRSWCYCMMEVKKWNIKLVFHQV